MRCLGGIGGHALAALIQCSQPILRHRLAFFGRLGEILDSVRQIDRRAIGAIDGTQAQNGQRQRIALTRQLLHPINGGRRCRRRLGNGLGASATALTGALRASRGLSGAGGHPGCRARNAGWRNHFHRCPRLRCDHKLGVAGIGRLGHRIGRAGWRRLCGSEGMVRAPVQDKARRPAPAAQPDRRRPGRNSALAGIIRGQREPPCARAPENSPAAAGFARKCLRNRAHRPCVCGLLRRRQLQYWRFDQRRCSTPVARASTAGVRVCGRAVPTEDRHDPFPAPPADATGLAGPAAAAPRNYPAFSDRPGRRSPVPPLPGGG